MQMIIDADPVLGLDPFDNQNEALKEIVKIGLNQFLIIHESYIDEIVEYALSSESLDEEIGGQYDEEATQNHRLNLVREYRDLVTRNPNVVGDTHMASQMLAQLAISTRISVNLAKKISKGALDNQVNLFKKLLADQDPTAGDNLG
jgi:hypothetical protein